MRKAGSMSKPMMYTAARFAFLEKRLARYKVPKEIFFVVTLPRTPYGKLVKGELRELYERLKSSESAKT